MSKMGRVSKGSRLKLRCEKTRACGLTWEGVVLGVESEAAFGLEPIALEDEGSPESSLHASVRPLDVESFLFEKGCDFVVRLELAERELGVVRDEQRQLPERTVVARDRRVHSLAKLEPIQVREGQQ